MPENMDIYKDGEQEKRRKVIDPNGGVYYVEEADYEPRPTPEPERVIPQEGKEKDQIQMICPESGTVVTIDVEESVDGEMVAALSNPRHTLGPQMTADVMTCQDEPYDPEKHGEAPDELPLEEVCASGAVKVPYMMKGTGAMGARTLLPVYVSQKVFDDVLLQLYKALEAGKDRVAVDFHRKKHQNFNTSNAQETASYIPDPNNIQHELVHDVNYYDSKSQDTPSFEESNQIPNDSQIDNTDGFSLK